MMIKDLRIAIRQFIVTFVILHIQCHVTRLTFEAHLVPVLKTEINITLHHTFCTDIIKHIM